jgi:hypothetical protein
MKVGEIVMSEPVKQNDKGMLVQPLFDVFNIFKYLILEEENDIINRENFSSCEKYINDFNYDENLELNKINENKLLDNDNDNKVCIIKNTPELKLNKKIELPINNKKNMGDDNKEAKHAATNQEPNNGQKNDSAYIYSHNQKSLKTPKKKNKNENKISDNFEKEKKEHDIKYSFESTKKESKKIFIKNRKFMKDNRRKRIKSDFYRKLKRNLNNKLKALNLFDENDKNFDFSQYMIINVTQKANTKHLNMTLKEILLEHHEKNFSFQQNNYIINKYMKKDDALDKILKIQTKFLFNEYLNSEEFQESIKKLSENENYDYIHKYIKVAENFVFDFIKEKIDLNKEFHIFNKIQNNYKSIYIQKPIFSQYYKNLGKRDSEIKFLNRKRMRTKFYKFIIKKLNELTKSKKYSFQQSMTYDEKNKKIANLTLKTILDTENFFKENSETVDIEKLNDTNNELAIFLKMTIKDIYEHYLSSNQFSLSIEEYEEEKEYYDDIFNNKETKTMFFDSK